MRVRPSEITGVVAYTGILEKRGKCLQQCANAPRCATVTCVRRITDRVGTCLHHLLAYAYVDQGERMRGNSISTHGDQSKRVSLKSVFIDAHLMYISPLCPIFPQKLIAV